MEQPSIRRPVRIQAEHKIDNFCCGEVALDDWVQKFALTNDRAGMARVFVAINEEDEVSGYYALCTGGVEPIGAPARVKKGLPRHSIPVIILARLAVDIKTQGHGLGISLLKDALRRTAIASDEVGIRAILIHAKDANAKAFYMKFAEFEESPTDPLHLFLLLKDLKAALNP